MMQSLASFSIRQKFKIVREGGPRAIHDVKVLEPPSLYRYEYEARQMRMILIKGATYIVALINLFSLRGLTSPPKYETILVC